ncbi:hypothetical protein C0995_011315 [Termitomyces sp. Mi166|nr:hypothetical protein C0995_011315 [Termitomyces sp. Mi166\
MHTVEGTSSELQLPQELKDLLEKAYKEPEAHITRVPSILDHKYPTLKQHPDILEFYISQFDPEPPTIISHDSVFGVIYALHELQIALIPLGAELKGFKQFFLSAWPKMWKWLEVLYRTLVLESDGIHFNRTYGLAAAIEYLFYLAVQPPLDPGVASSKGFLGLCAAIFIDRARHPPRPEHLLDRSLHSTETLYHLLRSPLSNIHEFRHVIGFNKNKAAHTLFQPGLMCIRGGSQWSACLPFFLNVYFELCLLNPEIYRGLSCRLVVSYFCETLAFLLSSPEKLICNYSPPSPYEASALITVLMLMHRYITICTDGHSWIVYALRHDLASLLLKTAAHRDPHPDFFAGIEDLIHVLRANSIHRPVLRRITLPSVDPAILQEISDTKIRSTWSRLETAVGWANAAHVEFFLQGNYSPQCSYDKVIFSLPWICDII